MKDGHRMIYFILEVAPAHEKRPSAGGALVLGLDWIKYADHPVRCIRQSVR
jgi:hypothetical protein